MINKGTRPAWREYKKGDVVIANFGKPLPEEEKRTKTYGFRPCVVISNDMGNKHSPKITVALMKQAKSDLPTHVFIEARDLLRDNSFIMCETVETIDKVAVVKLKTKLRPIELEALDEGLKIAFGIK